MPIQRITSGILADGAILATDIADGIVTNAKLAGSITSDKITSVSNTALSGVVNADQLASTLDLTGKTVTLPAGTGGKVLQVVSTTKTDAYSVSLATATTDTTDAISASITPTSASSKILVIASLHVSFNQANRLVAAILHRDGNVINGYTGDASGNRSRVSIVQRAAVTGGFYVLSGIFLDSPNTTSATTYSFRLRHGGEDTTTIFLNAVAVDDDVNSSMRSASTITVMEIAA